MRLNCWRTVSPKAALAAVFSSNFVGAVYYMPESLQSASINAPPRLIRGIGLAQATALNMIDMIGVGPFITIPLMIATMHGPQAMLGWILGAVLVVCDGMVWAELGAAIPQAGGPVRYLRAM